MSQKSFKPDILAELDINTQPAKIESYEDLKLRDDLERAKKLSSANKENTGNHERELAELLKGQIIEK